MRAMNMMMCVWCGVAVLAGVLVGACAGPSANAGAAGGGTRAGTVDAKGHGAWRMLVDFEKAGAGVTWEPLRAGVASSEPAASAPAVEEPVIVRSSIRPQEGLWAEQVRTGGVEKSVGAGGAVVGALGDGKVLDLGAFNLVTAQVAHLGAAGDNGAWVAAIALTDSTGKKVEGDSFAITGRWAEIALDLREAFDEGLDVSRVVEMRVIVRRARVDAPVAAEAATEPGGGGGGGGLILQTDAWKAEVRGKVYLAGKNKANVFYVESEGNRLRMGTGGLYELVLSERGLALGGDGKPAKQRPWLDVRRNGKETLGQPGTGLMLLDAGDLNMIRGGADGTLQRGADDVRDGAAKAVIPVVSWPVKSAENFLAESRWTWEVVWTSPAGAIVEMVQEVGPYDRQGEPAVIVKWRLMVYPWGQAFVHAEWTRGGASALVGPASWGLVLDEAVMEPALDANRFQGRGDAADPVAAENAQRLLAEMYPASVRDGLQTALPHRMQSGAPVAMIAKTLDATGGAMAKDAWWWARGKSAGEEEGGLKKVIGAGISPGGAGAGDGRGHADCMLVLTAPDVLRRAGTFGQYLVPAKIVTRQGELDRNFPGDAENDGFVEAYGFQVVRLAGGRATFTVYPQNRPLFFPVFLFTVPAVEREAVDVAHARVLINIDGKQFADPPQFPDGSFLLQLPLVVDRPVTIEARLERR